MSDEIVFDVLCTKVLDALRALGLGKFSIRNYYYEGMWPIIKVYRSEGVILYSAAFTNEIVDRFRLEHENGLVADRIWAKVRKAAALFEEYVQTGKIVWKRVRPAPKIPLTPYYQELLCSFCQHEANTRAIGFESLRDEENICRKFFAYLDDNDCHTCQDINLGNVNAFLVFIASHRKSSMDRVGNTLKHLSAYLVSTKSCRDFSAALITRPAPRKKLRPAFSSKEVRMVMDTAAKNPTLGCLTLLNNRYTLNNIKSKTVGDGQHGTARWATDAEIRKAYALVPFQAASWRRGQRRPEVQGLVLGSISHKRGITALVDKDDVHCLTQRDHLTNPVYLWRTDAV